MKKLLGITGLLLAVFVVTTLLAQQADGSNSFLTAYNLQNLLRLVRPLSFQARKLPLPPQAGKRR